MICVDPIRPCKTNRRWRWSKSCHLYSDPFDADELHAFAQRLDLKRRWFQDHPSLPHYDLTEAKRRQAVSLGASEVTVREVAEAMKRHRRATS